MSSRRLSHILIRVADLHAAVATYRALGFTCVWGADPDRAHNALIYFEEGPFLELFTPPAPSKARDGAVSLVAGPRAAARLRRWATPGEGPIEYAVEIPDFELGASRADLRKAGIRMSRPFRGRRRRPDGIELAWWLSMPSDLELPFLMGTYRPADDQPPEARRHLNGARRVAALDLTHPDPAGYATRLALYLADAPDGQGIRISEGKAYGVVGLRIEGLAHDIPPEAAHGALFSRA
ncbi:VOC family protein [Phenylobacterium sp.]|uniref:VOC family protein n=1 Tax=Phenylobacterium sp. TaxID=1871053 RepID=UPI00301CCADB